MKKTKPVRGWGQTTDREKVFANHIFDKNIISRICKELWKFNSIKTNQLGKCAKTSKTNKDLSEKRYTPQIKI